MPAALWFLSETPELQGRAGSGRFSGEENPQIAIWHAFPGKNSLEGLWILGLQAPLGAKFRHVAIGALVERARARPARPIHAARWRPSGRSLAAS
jgi:hypothetical protein